MNENPRKVSKTEFDAVHPRFKNETKEEMSKYEKTNYYFCEQCKLYFAPTVLGLETHFTKEIITHNSFGVCFYCKGSVYQYLLNGTSLIFHNCKDSNR